jgi:glyoxylase-like metal-dependent hydrolase (beta-lactamase superfamily II)
MTELREVADRIFVYLQPDGAWGLSNAGLVIGETERLLVDTFFDLPRTRDLLTQLRRVTAIDDDPTVVVNTHTNGDHCYGNALLSDRRIISSERATRELSHMPARKFDKLMKIARVLERIGGGRKSLRSLLSTLGLQIGVDFVDAAPYVLSIFSQFELANIPLVPPNETFSNRLQLELGGREINLIELSPAHTEGDVVAFDTTTRTLFAGDLIFMGSHPLAWAGTPENCIDALKKLLELDPVAVIPGHGPITNREGIKDHISYFESLRNEVKPLFHSGVSAENAARQLMVKGFGSRAFPERLFVNVEAAYREFSPNRKRIHVLSAMGAMSRLAGFA